MSKTNSPANFSDPALWEPIKLGELALDGQGHPDVSVSVEDGKLVFENKATVTARFRFDEVLFAPDGQAACALFELSCDPGHGSGAIVVNGTWMPLSGKANIPITPGQGLHVALKCAAQTRIVVHDISISWHGEMHDLLGACEASNDVLVVTPDYPSHANLYLCAFAHSRVKLYREQGLKVQVLSVNPYRHHQMAYSWDGVPVFVGGIAELKRLISRKQYKVIVTHFVEEYHYRIYDGYVTNEQLVFICHGPETTYNYIRNVCKPYFTSPETFVGDSHPERTAYLARYAKMRNAHWVFVSEWLRDTSEQELGASFLNSSCIYNTIDERLFPYCEKRPEDRKRILMLRKFDNIKYHSVDIAVQCILELSRRPFFEDLQIDIVGDGSIFEEITAPVKQFDNVSVQRKFVPNDQIAKLHADHGIMLLPSRHDAHAVSMSEAASSGLVVVGSRVTSNPYFMDEEHNRTLAPPEDPIALADIIERLYNDPDEFLTISKRLSERIRSMCCVANTASKEVELIRSKLDEANCSWFEPTAVSPADQPTLSIVVPTSDANSRLLRCLHSLTCHAEAADVEVIVSEYETAGETARALASHQNDLPANVKVLNAAKKNRGGALAAGIDAAHGRYIRVVDGNDWLVPDELARQIKALREEDADLILTEARAERADEPDFGPLVDYQMLGENRLYHFEDLLYPMYGFGDNWPTTSTCTFSARLFETPLPELPDDDGRAEQELMVLALSRVDTVRSYNLDVYRSFELTGTATQEAPTAQEQAPTRLSMLARKAVKGITPYGALALRWRRQEAELERAQARAEDDRLWNLG